MRPAPTDGPPPFVHVGRAGDPDLRWLVESALPPEPCAYTCVDGEPTLYAPPRRGGTLDGPLECARDPARVAAEALPAGPVYAPRHLPHDAALLVERAGGDLRSTTAVETARAEKTTREVESLADAAAAAAAGLSTARETLAGLVESGATAETLRRRVAGGVAAAGATPRVSVSGALADAAPVTVDCVARSDGYHARLRRTLVVAGDGGAVRRAHVACESALRVAASEATPGTEVGWLADELRAELGSFGVEPLADETLVAGTGLARREAPRRSDETLAPGHAAVVAPAARVPASERAVGLAETVVVGEDGGRVLADAPTRSGV